MKMQMRDPKWLKSFCVRFARDEEGGITVLTLLLLIVMLVLGGMAVDFMRFEAERAKLQSVADRAVLAAAELDQTLDGKVVVNDFFTKAGYGNNIIGEPTILENGGSRTVNVQSEIDVNTFYLRLIGIDTLTAPAASTAIEGTGNVEVSLILDISWSMNKTVESEGGQRRIELLRTAAQQFIDDLLLDEYKNEISVNLIPYSQQVRVSDELWGAINTTPQTISDASGSHTNTTQCIDFEPYLGEGETWSTGGDAGDYGTLEFDFTKTYNQVEDAWFYDGYEAVCPPHDYQEMIVLSQNRDALKTAIGLLEPSLNTSIHIGLKWGTALLDPSMRDVLGGLSSTDPAFAGQRPADYTGNNTVKYVILMTDGENHPGARIQPEYYNSVSERVSRSNSLTPWDHNYFPGTAENLDDWLQSMCSLAKAQPNVKIYTIAMGASEHGEGEMEDCATAPSYAFATSFSTADGDKGIDEIFETIANQITALRLSN